MAGSLAMAVMLVVMRLRCDFRLLLDAHGLPLRLPGHFYLPLPLVLLLLLLLVS